MMDIVKSLILLMPRDVVRILGAHSQSSIWDQESQEKKVI